MAAPLPTLFLSHGAPDLVLRPQEPAHAFLRGLAATLPRPRAMAVCSAHWQAAPPEVEVGERPPTIHDFAGFGGELDAMAYPAVGDPGLAERILALLAAWSPRGRARGYDHGAWVPLRLLYPEADIPVVQISLLRGGGPAEHLALGAALAPLRHEQVLVIGSGSATHRLDAVGHGPAPDWVTAFDAWLERTIVDGDRRALLAYRQEAPAARENHPTEEHLLPLFTALGAAGPDAPARLLHRSITYRALSMSAYAFGG